MAKKELTKREDMPLTTYDYGDHAGVGFEDQTSDDIQIPFISLLQALSPQVLNKVDGAEPGKFFNTVTEEIYDGELEFIPCLKERAYIEWIPRDAGGGFVARHEENSDVVRRAIEIAGTKFGKLKHPDEKNDNDLVATVYLYGLVLRGDEKPEFAVIVFTSTKLTAYKKWNTKIRMCTIQTPDGRKQQPPIYAHRVRVGSTSQTNRANQTFHNVIMQPAEKDVKSSLMTPDDPRFQLAHELAQMIKSGIAKAAEETQGTSAVTGDDDGGGVF